MDDMDLNDLESFLNDDSYLLPAEDELFYSSFTINLPDLDPNNKPESGTSSSCNCVSNVTTSVETDPPSSSNTNLKPDESIFPVITNNDIET